MAGKWLKDNGGADPDESGRPLECHPLKNNFC